MRRGALVGLVALVGPSALAADPPLLPPEQAFRFAARSVDASTIEARFEIADGYYLYRDKLRFAFDSGGQAPAAVELPRGRVKEDKFFGRVETYRDAVVVRLPVASWPAGRPLVVEAETQGCADVGVCYPPNVQKVTLARDGGARPGAFVYANPPRARWFQ